MPIELRPRRTDKCGVNVAEPSSFGRGVGLHCRHFFLAAVAGNPKPKRLETQSRSGERGNFPGCFIIINALVFSVGIKVGNDFVN